MQAILKGKHQRFFKWLQSIRDRQLNRDPQLDKLEEEMLQCYDLYQQKREELRKVITEYEEKQKGIRNKIKGYKRQDLKTAATAYLSTENENQNSIAV